MTPSFKQPSLRINILTSRFPYPLEKGDKLRIYNQIKLLSEHHEIFLFCINDKIVSQQDLDHLSTYCAKIKIYHLAIWKRLWTVFTGILSGLPIHVAYFYDKSFKNDINIELSSTGADLTLCQLIRVVPYVTNFEGPIWIDFMDSFSGNLKRRYKKAPWWEKIWLPWEINKIAKIEQMSLSIGQHFTIISEQDRSEIDPNNDQDIFIIPNGVDTTYFCPNEYQYEVFDICFTGNLGYEPNIKAALYLIKKIGPKVEEDYTIRIAGARPHKSLLKLSNSKYHINGWVEDIRDVYWSGKIFVAPLFTGSGQQNKILEAMACGTPVITTSLVNNAIGAEPGKEILIADDLKSFLIQIDSLRDDENLLHELSENARDFVVRKYTWKKIGEEMEEFVGSKYNS